MTCAIGEAAKTSAGGGRLGAGLAQHPGAARLTPNAAEAQCRASRGARRRPGWLPAATNGRWPRSSRGPAFAIDPLDLAAGRDPSPTLAFKRPERPAAQPVLVYATAAR